VDIELFRYELTIKNPDTGAENQVIVYAVSEEQALITTGKTKEQIISIEKKYVTETQSNNS
jgi:hypothetical protein